MADDATLDGPAPYRARNARNGELTLRVGRWTLSGVSVAGDRTCLIVHELRICFDMGVAPSQLLSVRGLLVSHGHRDHFGAAYYIDARRKTNGAAAAAAAAAEQLSQRLVVLPRCCVAPLLLMATAISFADCGKTVDDPRTPLQQFARLRCRMVEAESIGAAAAPCVLPWNAAVHVRAYPMRHPVTSFGYVLFEQRRKLLDAFRGRPGAEIAAARRAGGDDAVSAVVEHVLVAFSGDTSLDAVLACGDMLRAEVLLLECTYMGNGSGGDTGDGASSDGGGDDDGNVTAAQARERGHVHFDDIVDNAACFSDVGNLVLCHVSPRYRHYDTDVAPLLARLPADLRRRTSVWVDRSGSSSGGSV